MNFGQLLQGIIGVTTGLKALRAAFEDERDESGPVAEMPASRSGGRMVARVRRVRNLDERIKYIHQMACKGRLDPKVRKVTVQILSRRCGNTWCTPEKDWEREVKTIFTVLRQRYYRYVHDTHGVDLFQHPRRTLEFGGGDCDDGTILLASMLMSVGYEVKMRVIQTIDADAWNHIYLVCKLPPQGRKGERWIPLDLSVNKPPGWEAPRAMVRRFRDYPVNCS